LKQLAFLEDSNFIKPFNEEERSPALLLSASTLFMSESVELVKAAAVSTVEEVENLL
jgi:hypothetical protein